MAGTGSTTLVKLDVLEVVVISQTIVSVSLVSNPLSLAVSTLRLMNLE